MISIVLGNAFSTMQVFIPDAHVKWRLFSTLLFLVGGLTVVVALLPSSWLTRTCKVSSNDLSIPIKMLGGFAGFSYLLTVALHFVPPSWHPAAQLVYLLCPACVLTITVDPSLATVLLVLAPLNAAVYASLGTVFGCFVLAVRDRP
jgi:hypothetical protein